MCSALVPPQASNSRRAGRLHTSVAARTSVSVNEEVGALDLGVRIFKSGTLEGALTPVLPPLEMRTTLTPMDRSSSLLAFSVGWLIPFLCGLLRLGFAWHSERDRQMLCILDHSLCARRLQIAVQSPFEQCIFQRRVHWQHPDRCFRFGCFQFSCPPRRTPRGFPSGTLSGRCADREHFLHCAITLVDRNVGVSVAVGVGISDGDSPERFAA